MKKLLKLVLRKWGLEIRRLPLGNEPAAKPLSRLENFLTLWKRLGDKPSHIVDVGANHGHWTRSVLQYFPDSRYLLVEPQERLNAFMEDLSNDSRVHLANVGISDEPGVLSLALPNSDDSATFLSEAAKSNPTIEVPVTTLDSLVEECFSIPDICKIYAEGFDLKALRGAKSLLGNTEVFLVEVAVCAGGLENTVDRVVSFMSEHNYRVFDLTDLNRSPRDLALWLAEIVFVKRDSPVWEKLNSYE